MVGRAVVVLPHQFPTLRHQANQSVAVRHPRHVLLDDRPLVQYVGKGTFFPTIYESMAVMTRVTAKFG